MLKAALTTHFNMKDSATLDSRLDASTFASSIRMLPQFVRADVRLFYLVVSALDDAVDEGTHDEAEPRVAAVEAWCREGTVGSLEAKMLAELAERWPIPRQPVLDFCAGMRHDLKGASIETEVELDRYCYQVGGTIGLIVTAMLGTRTDADESKAAALGMAMQRTNILRDIDVDLALGRVYIARETIEKFGSLAPGKREALARDQIARADRLFEEGILAIPMLARGQKAISLAAALYKEILRQIEREGYGRKPGPVTVPGWRRLLIRARHRP